MKETPRRRITVTSSFWEKLLRPPHPFLQQASGQIFEDDVYGFLHFGYFHRAHPFKEQSGCCSSYKDPLVVYSMYMDVYMCVSTDGSLRVGNILEGSVLVFGT